MYSDNQKKMEKKDEIIAIFGEMGLSTLHNCCVSWQIGLLSYNFILKVVFLLQSVHNNFVSCSLNFQVNKLHSKSRLLLQSVLGDQAFKINITHKFPIFEKISPVKNYPKVCLFSLWRKRISQKLCTTSPPLPNIIYGVYNVHIWPWYLPCMNLTIATGWNLKIKYWSMLPIKL